MERTISVALAAATPVRAHFCDYATGVRLLAANHKNDTDSCAIPWAPLRSIALGGKESTRNRERPRAVGCRDKCDDKRHTVKTNIKDE